MKPSKGTIFLIGCLAFYGGLLWGISLIQGLRTIDDQKQNDERQLYLEKNRERVEELRKQEKKEVQQDQERLKKHKRGAL